MFESGRFAGAQKAEHIATDLRRRIARGDYPAGGRIPTRAELCATYDVSNATLQRALNWLIQEGFVICRGRSGTFVRTDSPHLTQYALIFPLPFPNGNPTHGFFRALRLEAEQLEGPATFRIIDGFTGSGGMLDYQELLDDVRNNRLAGLIFAAAPTYFIGSPLLAQDGVPCTAIMAPGHTQQMPAVTMDEHDLVMRMADYLRDHGRHRTLVLVNSGSQPSDAGPLREILASRGLKAGPHDIVGVSLQEPGWTEAIVVQHFDRPAGQRADAMIVLDDAVLPDAVRGLATLGLRVPSDVLVVAASWFPWPVPAASPVTRFGFSVPDILKLCMETIDGSRQGKAPPAVQRIAACPEPPHDGPVTPTA